MNTRDIPFGKKSAVAYQIDLPGDAPLLVGKGKKGFVMCGFLDVARAEKVGVAAAVVRGVKNMDELLDKPVTATTAAAAKMGVKTGMSGREALEILA
jgi:uncharacterized protein YunC (DUF1805 family)